MFSSVFLLYSNHLDKPEFEVRLCIIVYKFIINGNNKDIFFINNRLDMGERIMKIGILTSGGDCQALNAAMYGVVTGLYERYGKKAEIYGIKDGYTGLIDGKYEKMKYSDFENILKLGGTILGSSRQPFKKINEEYKDGKTKVQCMMENYENMGLECLVILGGNGSHKTANLLSENGLNIITLPKTIDNDIYGTDMTFGFASAIDRATEYMDNLKSTAVSHNRVFIVEVMGNKAGWLTINAGIATGADVILIPEIPYDIKVVKEHIHKKISQGKRGIIVAVAEGILTLEESKLSKKQFKEKRAKEEISDSAQNLEKQLQNEIDAEVRRSVIGHIQRGGQPSAYDRVLASRLGAEAAQLIAKKQFGYMVAIKNGVIEKCLLKVIAGKKKTISVDEEILVQAEMLDICLGR